METASRTSRSLKNMTVSLIFLGVTAILQFISRRIFLERLGTEVLGLNTTAVNLLQFLNLAELGVGVAIGYALYKPISEGNKTVVAEIVALQGHLYRRVAAAVLVGAVILSCFFPLIFKKMELPLWYAYASFGVMLLSSLLSYFFNYRQIVLSADQREYNIKFAYSGVMAVKVLAQMFAVAKSSDPYVWWLVIEAVGAVIATVSLEMTVSHIYPHLRRRYLPRGSELKKKYPEIVANTRRLFIHRISEYILRQTSPLVIYACVSMAMVALYGNYMVIVAGLLALLESAMSGISAGVGNLVAEGDDKRSLNVFSELFSIRFFCCTVATAAVFAMMPSLIVLWIGPQYLLSPTSLALIAAIFFINGFRHVIDIFKVAYGLFADVWAAIAEASLNLGLSVVFGIFWGLPGILAGVLVSLLVIVIGWKPLYLYRRGFRRSAWLFWGLMGRHIAATVPATGIMMLVCSHMDTDPTHDVGQFLLYGLCACGTFSLVLLAAMLALTPGTRMLVKRIKCFRS